MDPRTDQSMRARRGLLIVLSSPSGAGKSTISRMLLAADEEVTMSVSATTVQNDPAKSTARTIILSTIRSSTQ